MRRFLRSLGQLGRGAPGWGLSALLVAGVMTAALGWMVLDRASILRGGQRIELRPQPVDPRDLFRGDYVILTYEISSPPAGLWNDASELGLVDGDRVWVRILRELDPAPGAPLWRVAELFAAPPASGAGRDSVVLQGRLRGSSRVDYGVERYYVPEGEGLALEALIGAETGPDGFAPIVVEIAVDRNGRAAIGALKVRGQRVFEEPLY